MREMYSIPDEAFRTSSYSQPTSGNCVAVADLPGAAAVRDSQNPQQGHLVFPAEEWVVFLSAARIGEL